MGQEKGPVELRTLSSIREVEEAAWDGLLGPDPPPHMRWVFLNALEETGCVQPDKGWGSCHLTFHRDGKLVGAAPAYVKGNSDGEFVFDHSWARFSYQEFNVPYYPKLISAVPFTPANGPRLICKEADRLELSRAYATALIQLAEHFELSGAHVLFPNDAQAELLRKGPLLYRAGVQYHWHNPGYQTFEDFVSRFKSKRRNQIRRERRELEKQGLEIELQTGSDLDAESADWAFEFYLSTINKYLWGRQYLNRAFFEEMCSKMREHVFLFRAREVRSRRPIAGAFNLVGGGAMYGRYWGAFEERPYLHFNVCYYRGIEECIARGLKLFEPGAGGEHKIPRGFEPTITHSFHHIRHPGLRAAIIKYLDMEREWVEKEISEKEMLRPYQR